MLYCPLEAVALPTAASMPLPVGWTLTQTPLSGAEVASVTTPVMVPPATKVALIELVVLPPVTLTGVAVEAPGCELNHWPTKLPLAGGQDEKWSRYEPGAKPDIV